MLNTERQRKNKLKNYFCAYSGECYSMGQGLKSWLWACGKGFSSIFGIDLDFLGFVWYTYIERKVKIK